jgi:DNA-binding winged helix-turn-helix (wHTH) protein
MSMRPGWIFQFGEFQLDVRGRSLRREKTIVPLNSRAFDVLLYFVQNPGKVLTREELLKNVWAGSFVDENSLAQSISALRRALEEKPGDNNYIVTLPGRGYQFVSPVQVVTSEKEDAQTEEAPSTSKGPSGLLFQKQTIQTSLITTNEEKEQLSLPGPRSRALAKVVAVLAVAVISVAGNYAWQKFHRAPAANRAAISLTASSAPARRSIAVLGFRNLSGRPEEGWLSTALAEMLSTELEAGEKLRLVSGEDVARTKLDLFIVFFLLLFLVRLLAKEDICGFVGIFRLAFVAVELLLKARPRIGSPPKSAPSNVSVASSSYRVSTLGIRQKGHHFLE